jgi:hypothetical protein
MNLIKCFFKGLFNIAQIIGGLVLFVFLLPFLLVAWAGGWDSKLSKCRNCGGIYHEKYERWDE